MRTEEEWYALLRGFYNDLCNIGAFGENPSIARIEVRHVTDGMKKILDSERAEK